MVGKLRRLSSCSLLKLPFWGIPHVRTHLRVGQHVGDTSLCPSIWVCPKIWLCGYTMMYTPRIAIILTRKKKKKHLEKKNEKKKTSGIWEVPNMFRRSHRSMPSNRWERCTSHGTLMTLQGQSQLACQIFSRRQPQFFFGEERMLKGRARLWKTSWLIVNPLLPMVNSTPLTSLAHSIPQSHSGWLLLR